MSISGYGGNGGSGPGQDRSRDPASAEENIQFQQHEHVAEDLNRMPLDQFDQQASNVDLFGAATDFSGNLTKDEEILKRSLEESFVYEELFDPLVFEQSLELILPNIRFSQPSEINPRLSKEGSPSVDLDFVLRFELFDPDMDLGSDAYMNLMKKYIRVKIITIKHQNLLDRTINDGLCTFLDDEFDSRSQHLSIRTLSLESAKFDADNLNILRFDHKGDPNEPLTINYNNDRDALAFLIRTEFDFEKFSREHDFNVTRLMADKSKNGKASLVVFYERGSFTPYNRVFRISSQAYPNTQYIFKNDLWQGPTTAASFSWLDYRYNGQLISRSDYYMPEYITDVQENEIPLVSSRVLNESRVPFEIHGFDNPLLRGPKIQKLLKTSYKKLSAIGALYLAKSSDQTSQLIFSVDQSLLAKQTTTVPELFDISPRFLTKTRIASMKITRRRIKSTSDFSDMNRYKSEPVEIARARGTEFGEFEDLGSDNGTIREVFLHIEQGNKDVRHFAITDNNISKEEYGDYLYSVEINFENLASDLIEEIYSSIIAIQKNFSAYKTNLEYQAAYSKRKKMEENKNLPTTNPLEAVNFSKEYINDAAANYGKTGDLPWVNYVSEYVEAVKLISSEENNYFHMAKEKLNNISPFTGNLTTIKKFDQELMNMLEKLLRLIDRLGLQSPLNSLGRKISRLTKFNHDFNNVEEILSNPFIGYNFLNLGDREKINDSGFEELNSSDLSSDSQFGFGIQPYQGADSDGGFSTTAAKRTDAGGFSTVHQFAGGGGTGLTKFEFSKLTKFTGGFSLKGNLPPTAVKLPGEKIPLDIGITTADAIEAKVLKWNAISKISRPKEINCNSEVPAEIQAEQYELYELLSGKGISIDFAGSPNQASLSREENADRFHILDHEVLEEASEIAAGFCGFADVGEHNILGFLKAMSGNFIRSPKGDPACNASDSISPISDQADLREKVSANVEYLAGFKVDLENESMMKFPIWKNISDRDLENLQITRPLLCRINLSDDTPAGLKLPVMNKYFFLRGEPTLVATAQSFGLSSEVYIEDPALKNQLTEIDNHAMIRAIGKV